MGREVKRVPLDFDWPVDQVWGGYLNPFYAGVVCDACDGTGMTPSARLLQDQWFGNATFKPEWNGSAPFPHTHPVIQRRARLNTLMSVDFQAGTRVVRDELPGDALPIEWEARRLASLFNGSWHSHLSQADVDVLAAAGHLKELTHAKDAEGVWLPKEPVYQPAAAEVNEAHLAGELGVSSSTTCLYACMKARLDLQGLTHDCAACNGEREKWPCKAARTLYDLFVKIDPPAGEGWQVWSTTTEGSPKTPVFATPEALARHCVDGGVSSFGYKTESYATWLAFITGPGWGPSMVLRGDGEMVTGVAMGAETSTKE